ncbi:MAG: hypothetical protein MUF20_10430 [Methylotetracoccus sp.]|jgi:hypothetical protein|nr:hypothetical protein [Methylotetracoccus sp.]
MSPYSPRPLAGEGPGVRAGTISIALQPGDGAAKKLKAAVGEQPGYEILPNAYF